MDVKASKLLHSFSLKRQAKRYVDGGQDKSCLTPYKQLLRRYFGHNTYTKKKNRLFFDDLPSGASLRNLAHKKAGLRMGAGGY